MLSMLDRKLMRDLRRLWAQGLAVALVMACGVATIVLALGAYRSLEQTRATFYDRYRFATLFASVTRAPLHLKDKLLAIPGMAAVELRIVDRVLLDMPGMPEPGTGIAVSIPDIGVGSVNRLYLRSGRLPDLEHADEVAVSAPFAAAHHLHPGDSFHALMNGTRRTLKISGTVLSPEYVYAIGPGDMVPDPRRFGVFFMRRRSLEGTLDMAGSFNDVAAILARGADEASAMARIDAILKPYGGTGSYVRKDQLSNAFLDGELTQLRAMALIIPPIFLFVSAFLVNMVLSRLIALEREQIGLLKAVGFSNGAVGWHYAKLVMAIALAGLALGSVAGERLGHGLTILYGRFYSFPFLVFLQSPDLYAIAGASVLAAALVGTIRALWLVLVLSPAVAMRPPAPTRYRSLLSAGSLFHRLFSELTTMALRHLIRWPLRTFLTVFGTSLSIALLVTALFSSNSVHFMIDTIFSRTERQDASIAFAHELGPGAVQAVAAMPGILSVEPYRTVQVVMHHGHYRRRLAVTGYPPRPDLARLLDVDLDPVEPPAEGLLLSERVANLLHVGAGETVRLELVEQEGRTVEVPVAAVIQSFVGLTVAMRLDALDRLVGQGPRLSGARVRVDAGRLPAFYEAVKRTPSAGSVALLGISRARFRETIDENIDIMRTVYVALAVIITFGVVYNFARIQLSERARELASLRVLGFTRAEVSSVLLIELAVIVALAQPLGWLLGYLFSWSVTRGFESDLFRVPLIVSSATFATASLVVLAAALISALIVRRRIDRLDLVGVLKTRE